MFPSFQSPGILLNCHDFSDIMESDNGWWALSKPREHSLSEDKSDGSFFLLSEVFWILVVVLGFVCFYSNAAQSELQPVCMQTVTWFWVFSHPQGIPEGLKTSSLYASEFLHLLFLVPSTWYHLRAVYNQSVQSCSILKICIDHLQHNMMHTGMFEGGKTFWNNSCGPHKAEWIRTCGGVSI